MKELMSVKFNHSTSAQHKRDLRNASGTFDAEGMTISKATRSNLDRIASGQASYQQILTELRVKCEQPAEIPAYRYFGTDFERT